MNTSFSNKLVFGKFIGNRGGCVTSLTFAHWDIQEIQQKYLHHNG